MPTVYTENLGCQQLYQTDGQRNKTGRRRGRVTLRHAISGDHVPKLRLDVQLKHALNEATKVMRENLAERLVNLSCLGFTAERVSEFRLYHAERRFHVAPLVVTLHKHRLVVTVVVIHSTPERVLATSRRIAIRLERDVRHR